MENTISVGHLRFTLMLFVITLAEQYQTKITTGIRDALWARAQISDSNASETLTLRESRIGIRRNKFRDKLFHYFARFRLRQLIQGSLASLGEGDLSKKLILSVSYQEER